MGILNLAQDAENSVKRVYTRPAQTRQKGEIIAELCYSNSGLIIVNGLVRAQCCRFYV
jgi:hypothetical protein